MPRAIPAILAALAMVATACDDGASTPEPTPTVTVTVTQTPTPTTSPTPVDANPCVDLVGGDSLAFVFVTSPTPGTMVQSGFTFSGCSNSFEATYEWRLRDANGAVLANGFGTATCGTGCVGTFQQAVSYGVGQAQVGSLEVFTTSAQDGSAQDLNVIPLVLLP